MKLYSNFKNIVEKLKPIEIAWFTTFNLDCALLERFLLPIFVDLNISNIKTAEDFEALNYELKDINIKVWYDYRALNLSSDKRTTIDLIPVDLKKLYQTNKTDGVFHPKVIFLKSKKGAFIIAGSANLSISGWSSNCESVIIKEIRLQENAEQILDFFDSIGENVKDLYKWKNNLNKGKSDWVFTYTNNTSDNLLNKINAVDDKLYIWTPYFSKNTHKLLSKFKDYGYQKIYLIPDINELGKIRIPHSEILNIEKDKSFSIMKLEDDEFVDRLYHAKVWLTDRKLAVGSWNCSFRATGIDVIPTEKNVEAGILSEITSSISQTLTNDLMLFKKEELKGVDVDDIDKEWKQVLNNYSFSCIINANWETFRYSISNDIINNNYQVVLPHNKNLKLSLNKINGLSFRDQYKKLLKDKSFTVFDENGNEVFQGFLLEENKEKRPVFGYISLVDLLESLIDNPEGETPRKRLSYEDYPDENNTKEIQGSRFEYTGSTSYYLMFVSFQKLFDKIQESSNNKEKLDLIGYRLPGSLLNIKELIQESINETLSRSKTNYEEDNLLYHWFLINEINRCINEFNVNSLSGSLKLINLRQIQDEIRIDKADFNFLSKLKGSYRYGI